MRAAILTPDGGERIEGSARFAADDPAGPKRLAAELMARASPGLRAFFGGS